MVIYNKEIIGYTCGVFDLFHIGHLNILKKSKMLCDKLIVAVTRDNLVSYKGKKAYINENERLEIVNSCKYVDYAIFQDDIDKFKAWEKIKFDILFVGDDWKGNEKWNEWEKKLNEVNVKINYIPYTKNISSSLIRNKLNN